MLRFLSFILLFLFIGCRASDEKILEDFHKSHSDISFGYFGKDEKLFYVHSGCDKREKDILIFIHGSPGSWKDYKAYLMSENLRSRYCIISLDRPGYGKSNTKRSYADLEVQAEIIKSSLSEFLGSLNVHPTFIVYVGHSYGGPIAALVSLQDANRNDLVLISSPMDPNLEEVKWYNKLATMKIVQWFLPLEIIHSNEEMMPLKQQLEKLSTQWSLGNTHIMLIHGRDDFLVDFDNTKYVKSKIGNKLIKSIEIENENHFIPWTKFELVEAALSDLKK